MDKQEKLRRAREKYKEWYANPKNREKKAERVRRYQQTHPEKLIEWREKSRDYHKAYQHTYKDKCTQTLGVIKLFYGCRNPVCKCHGEFAPCELDFHHLTGRDSKRFSIAFLRQRNRAALAAELNKCVVLCANCHRRQHSPGLEANLTTNMLCQVDDDLIPHEAEICGR